MTIPKGPIRSSPLTTTHVRTYVSKAFMSPHHTPRAFLSTTDVGVELKTPKLTHEAVPALRSLKMTGAPTNQIYHSTFLQSARSPQHTPTYKRLDPKNYTCTHISRSVFTRTPPGLDDGGRLQGSSFSFL